MTALRAYDRQILQKYARKSEHQHSKMGPGWFVWGLERAPGHDPWTYDAFRQLVRNGLMEHREDWKHDYVKITEAGWEALGA